jgi:glyceraldehyde 3-phosphate dehydrogenase
MGLGQIGRQIYRLAAEAADLEIVAVADIGKPEVLQYLLQTGADDGFACRVEGNYLRGEGFNSRMLQLVAPGEVPWDAFGVDCVVDATGRYRSRAYMPRRSSLPAGGAWSTRRSPKQPDRVLIPGINERTPWPQTAWCRRARRRPMHWRCCSMRWTGRWGSSTRR